MVDPKSFNHKFATVNNVKIHYIDEGYSDKVILCVHGFPDIWYGWRHQIKYLASQGYRVIVPDIRGYGQSGSPDVTSATLSLYSTKNIVTDFIKLLDYLDIKKAIWLGHDWGGSIVWRAAMWYPSYVVAVISVCTPYSPPPPEPVKLSNITKVHKNWMYQAFFRTKLAADDLNNNVELFLKSIHRTFDEQVYSSVFSSSIPIYKRTITDVGDIKRSKLLSQQELDYYVEQYKINGFKNALNLYKTHEINWEMEASAGLVAKQLDIPCLMITVGKDRALPANFTKNMENYLPNLQRFHIEDAAHWVLAERSPEINSALSGFLFTLYPGSKL
ncbi:hypothetical protein BB560_003053 [Smittium megazygosporum]|uniref:AB hydrolase-1 domain-containing protein n=1 Tax=Smittium megazygosporum TaxID=133381 RepID=A0A2T9ZD31_9FUNG|nr:hypothetical protein BB560_003053 [Smittium megazygosporum]